MTFITPQNHLLLQLAGMDNQFWDQRYAENPTVYGEAPNRFFKSFIDKYKPGSILLPAEGEGRNALYAASKGWQVEAFDFSAVARNKALEQAKRKNLTISYWLQNLADYKATKKYDAIGLIYVHLPEMLRKKFHQEIYQSLQSGGFLVFEAFTKDQIHNNSGGPKDSALLYDAPTICNDFPFLHVLFCGQKEVVLNEGPFHQGKASVLQLVGQKL